jgi:hypothetical protein
MSGRHARGVIADDQDPRVRFGPSSMRRARAVQHANIEYLSLTCRSEQSEQRAHRSRILWPSRQDIDIETTPGTSRRQPIFVRVTQDLAEIPDLCVTPTGHRRAIVEFDQSSCPSRPSDPGREGRRSETSSRSGHSNDLPRTRTQMNEVVQRGGPDLGPETVGFLWPHHEANSAYRQSMSHGRHGIAVGDDDHRRRSADSRLARGSHQDRTGPPVQVNRSIGCAHDQSRVSFQDLHEGLPDDLVVVGHDYDGAAQGVLRRMATKVATT